MDAERLIGVSRHALAQSRAVPDIVAESWQAQALAQAIGGRLAVYGPLELRKEARGLSETGARGIGAPDHPGVRAGIRAAQLSEVMDARETLLALGALLGDVGIALVGVACSTDEEGLYWQCVEAIDAADESNDRVRGMLRRLAAREAGRRPEAARWRPGQSAAPDGGDTHRTDSRPRSPGSARSSVDSPRPARSRGARGSSEPPGPRGLTGPPVDTAAGAAVGSVAVAPSMRQ